MRPSAPTDRAGPKQDDTSRTRVDGAWWPRSVDPAVELPGLVLALQAQGPSDEHSPIVHIMLRATDWDAHPRRLRVDGPEDTREVLLSWFGNLPAGLLTAIYADGRRVDLLTVPASTDDAAARAALETAARMSAPEKPTDPRDRSRTRSTAQNAGKSDGGRLQEQPPAR
ncbi:DUF5994 family protein [Actinomadura sp. 7K534]|nr:MULTISPECIES: DUF5994 family protein [unclassified Actinomadura]